MQGVGGLPLRTDAGSERFLRDGIILHSANPRLQGLQHGAVRCLLDALRQTVRLRGSAIQYSFNSGRISTIAECGTDLLRDSRADCRVLQAFCTLPLCGNAGSKRFLGCAIALRGTDTRLQGLQHCTVSGLFDALRQFAYLRRSTVQHRFDGDRVSLVTEGRTDLLRDGSTGNRVLQGVRFLPLRANAGSQRFLRGAVALHGADTRLQGLQHRAVGGLFDTLRQCAHLRRSTVQHRFDGGRVSLVTEGSTDLLGDGGTGNWILQGVGFLPLRTDTGGKRFLCDAVALRGTNTRLQGLQHRTVSGLFDALRQFTYLRRSTVQHRFDGGRVSLVTEGRTDLLRDSRAGNRVLQGMRFLPLRANAGSQRFLRGAVALHGADTRLQGLQHRAVRFLAYALRQDGGFDGYASHGIACGVFAWCQADAGGLFVCAVRRYLAWRELNAGAVGSGEVRCCLA